MQEEEKEQNHLSYDDVLPTRHPSSRDSTITVITHVLSLPPNQLCQRTEGLPGPLREHRLERKEEREDADGCV
jgi:hypothetical protein